ncbi:hypothetical protein [uncultured Draconibacterium sp.]|uniref:hypothetical protein n=1 Tax=uncultured Draconibacterium sp. TaxID=1573823 RepID=UPI0025DA95E1|nr:hypothetical protein [uncultured Draconibacterium sp.]
MNLKLQIKPVLLLLIVVLSACSDDDEGLQHRDIAGTYQLTETSWAGLYADENGAATIGEISTSDCDLHSSIEISKRGEVTLIEYTGESCSIQNIKTGNWVVTQTFFGSFIGEIQFEGDDRLFNLLEIEHQENTITDIRITHDVVDLPENYENLIYRWEYSRIE